MENKCGNFHEWANTLPRHTFPFEKEEIPKNGIYILFEKGEKGHKGERIVRIGTHTGVDQLRSRLHQHFLTQNKDRSIFRKNIGRAFLQKSNDPFLSSWEIDLTPREARKQHAATIDFEKQKKIEEQVSDYIQNNFSFSVIRVDDKEERLLLESRIISTVSLCTECGSSKEWLGNHSPKEKIRESGLWLVNELYKQPLSLIELKTLKAKASEK